jgi:hypothetical protein
VQATKTVACSVLGANINYGNAIAVWLHPNKHLLFAAGAERIGYLNRRQ